VPQEQQSPSDRGEDREGVQQTLRALELPALVLAAGFQCFEELLNNPARPVAVDREGNRFRSIDRQVCEQKPFDSRLPSWRLLLKYVNDVELDRVRFSLAASAGAGQLDRGRGNTQFGEAKPSGWMPFALWSRNPWTW